MSDLVQGIAEFVRLLRHHGVEVGPGDSIDALRALSHLDISNRGEVYLGLRSVLSRSVLDYASYDAAFRIFFDGEVPMVELSPRIVAPDSTDGPGEAERGRVGGYSPGERLLRSDLAALSEGEQAEAMVIARRMARRLALRLSRRARTGRRGRLNLRQIVRRAVRYGGKPLELVRRRPGRRAANLVLLLDVSGSMEIYSRVLLQFVHALQSGLPRVRSFSFATRLVPISEELRQQGFEAAMWRAREKAAGWGGGTRIGACLTEFLREWGPSLLGRRSAVIILSDGLDTGDPEQVALAMAAISRGAGRVIWLNPLAGDPRYEPLARGMAAAAPYVDLLAPGHSLQSLAALERELALLKGRRRLD